MSVQQIEDALARQVLDGGEIDTALLELDVAPENLLNAYRAASFGQPPASREDLVGASAEVIARLPKELARKHRVVPFALHDGVLSVACAEPLDVFDARGVEQLTGLPVAWHVATELRVEASLAQHYDLDIPVRLRQLAEQVQSRDPGSLVDVEPMAVTRPPDSLADELFGSGDDDENEDDEPSDDAARDDASSHSAVAAEPSREAGSMAEALGRIPSPAPRVQVAPLPPPTIVTEHGAGDRALPQAKPVEVARVVALAPEAGDGATERISLPAGARLPRELSQGVFGASRAASAPTPARGTPRPRVPRTSTVPKGPLTAARARELLDAATDRDEVVDVFFNYARQYFESTALFSVREDRLLGLESHNTPAVDDVRELSILFEPGGVLEDMTRSAITRVIDLSRKDADHALALALGSMHTQPAALIPVTIRQRIVSIVYGDRAGQPFRVDDIAELIELLPSVSQAFERIIRNRKLFAMKSKRPPAMPKPSAPPPAVAPAPKRPSNAPAPRSAWSAAPPPIVEPPAQGAARPRSVPPPASTTRAHEQPTPHERRRSNAPTLAGLAADPSQRPTTARDMTSAAAQTKLRDARGETAFGRGAREAKARLSQLGVPRTAPPPPMPPASPREVLEQQPTLHLPAQRATVPQPSAAGGAARLSKPPPGAGSYNSREPPADPESSALSSFLRTRPSTSPELETRPIRRSRPSFQPLAPGSTPDTSEPPDTPQPRPSKPPARQSKLPPGTGSYKMQGGDTEVVSFAAKPPDPAGRASQPPSSYSASDRPPEHIELPPPPRVPATPKRSAADAYDSDVAPPPRRDSTSAITQPLGPRSKPPRSRPPSPDDRRDEPSEPPAATEVVRMSKALRDSLRPPAVASPSARMRPSMAVDASGQLKQLVSDLSRCGPDDEGRVVQALLRSGEAALPILVQHFPGPLWFDRRRPHPRLPMGRDVSAVARALSAFGEMAWPYIAELLCESDPDVRFYATLLASDRAQPPLIGVLADRLFDSDPQIRLVVKDVLPQYRSMPGFSEVLQMLRERSQNHGVSIQDRLAALDALAALRDEGSVPLLIRLNEDSDKQISLPAHRALSAITGQDFGASTRKWQSWHEANLRRHRVEWLIESLMHVDQPVRASAGIELQKLTQVYYGYVAAAPKRERERTQKRYQDWWEHEGRKRFAL